MTHARWLAVTLLLAARPAGGGPPPAEPPLLSAGAATVFDETRNAFGQPVPNLDPAHRARFFVGNSFFNENWIEAPASVASRDGLGPLFNARSCSSCHLRDGRSQPPASGQPFTTMLMRISLPGAGPHGQPRPDPIYGDQLQGDALPRVRPEAEVRVRYDELPGRYADGTPFSLRRPRYQVGRWGYGAPAARLRMSPRVAPAIVGLGLLEAVPAAAIEALADPDDRDGDGVSGRPNRVWDGARGELALGRFGWKAEQPSVRQQCAAAFVGDMGLTSRLFPQENHSPAQHAAARKPSGGSPEVGEDIFEAVVLYARTLGVPAQRAASKAGERSFTALGCARCHTPTLTTAEKLDLPELAGLTIHPYSDLLLHDLGEGLADDRPSFAADGREWRTPPLWGLGLLPRVSGHGFLLHDGRARDVAEAILWHGGEARAARDGFVALPAAARQALIAFVESL